MRKQSIGIGGAALLCALVAAYNGSALAASCLGTCGQSTTTDGVVTVPAGSTYYRWISTYDLTNSNNGFGQMPGVPTSDGSAGATNGTLYTTSPFTATAGTSLSYNFNYITSDGQTPGGGTYVYQDYAWAQLRDTANNIIATLLTARTEPSANIIPGVGMPGISAGVTLNPSYVPIINTGYTPGDANNPSIGPAWSPLGPSTGTCYGSGCGYTGWVNSTFAIQDAGTYVLLFGVTNWADTAFDSGFAFSGLTVGGAPLPGEGESEDISQTPIPAALPLFATGLGVMGWLARRKKRKAAATYSV